MSETIYFRATVATYAALQPAKKLSARFDIVENYPLFNSRRHNKKAGVYALCGLFGGRTLPKVYIGSAKNITKRVKNHFLLLSRGEHENSPLQKAYNKCPDGWVACVLEELEDEAIPRVAEQKYLDAFRPFVTDLNGLNVAKNAMAASLGLRFKRTGRALENLREGNRKNTQNPEWRRKVAVNNRRKAKDPKFIAKLKKAQSNRSEEHKLKLKARYAEIRENPLFWEKHRQGILNAKKERTKEQIERDRQLARDKWLNPACRDAIIRKNTAPLPKLFNKKTGEVVEAGFWGARAFCEEREINLSSFRDMLRGRKKQYRGWTACHE
jgi:group I intron endonuclease